MKRRSNLNLHLSLKPNSLLNINSNIQCIQTTKAHVTLIQAFRLAKLEIWYTRVNWTANACLSILFSLFFYTSCKC